MILPHTKNVILAGITLGFLAACSSTTTTDGGGGGGGRGGGGGGGGGDECPIEGELYNADTEGCYDPTDPTDPDHPDYTPPTERDGVTTGVLDGLISSNGLAFDGLNYGKAGKGEIDGDTLTLRALKLVRTVNGDTPSLSAELVDAEITISKNDSGNKWNAVVVFDDVTSPEFELTEGHAFTLSDTDYSFYIEEVTGNIFIIEATSINNPDFDAVDLDGVLFRAYTGFETDPAILDLLEGDAAIASYMGDFDVLLATDEGDLAIEGEIKLTANFDAGEITLGEMTATADADLLTVDFSGDISGNGWNATITDIDIDVDGDDDISLVGDDGGQLDGVFYGLDGEETAGTIIIDATLTDGIDDFDIVGGGGFVAEDCALIDGVDDNCVIIP